MFLAQKTEGLQTCTVTSEISTEVTEGLYVNVSPGQMNSSMLSVSFAESHFVRSRDVRVSRLVCNKMNGK